jgi:hypothetical protein
MKDDGDIVRGLGFVTMHAATVEEDVDDLLRILESIEPFDEKKQRWPISFKLKQAAKLVRELKCDILNSLPDDLENEGVGLFNRRNEFVHGRIYAGQDHTIYIQSGRPNIPTKAITSAELYDLANEFWSYRSCIIGPKLIDLPRALQKHRNGIP